MFLILARFNEDIGFYEAKLMWYVFCFCICEFHTGGCNQRLKIPRKVVFNEIKMDKLFLAMFFETTWNNKH